MATAKGGYYEDMIQQVTGVGLREAVIILDEQSLADFCRRLGA